MTWKVLIHLDHMSTVLFLAGNRTSPNLLGKLSVSGGVLTVCFSLADLLSGNLKIKDVQI